MTYWLHVAGWVLGLGAVGLAVRPIVNKMDRSKP